MTYAAALSKNLPSRKFLRIAAAFVILAGALVVLIWLLQINLLDVISQWSYVERLAQEMWPPNLQLLWTKRGLASSVLQTLSMAYLGTLAGGGMALVLAFLAASNTSPAPWLPVMVRTLLAIERSLPNFVVLLVLLIAVGIGPFAGMLSLTIGSVGMFGKLFADAIEQAESGTIEALQCVGATRLQVIRFGVLPQVAPSFVANLLYAFDVNLRAAIPLGVFGGGGIGFELTVADRTLRYRDMLAYTLLIVLLISSLERISDFVRRRFLTT